MREARSYASRITSPLRIIYIMSAQPPPDRQHGGNLRPPTAPPQRLPAHGYVIDRSAARTLSALAHGAIAFGLLGVGFLVSLAISAAIWLYGRRSPEVRFHSEQAGCYQCSVLLVNLLFVLFLGVTGGFSLFKVLRGESDWGTGCLTALGLIVFLAWVVGSIA